MPPRVVETETARESTKGSTLNRTLFRGVVTGVLGAAVAVTAAVMGPAAASGSTADTNRWTKPLPVAEQNAAMQWRAPRVQFLRHLHRQRHRPAPHRASRTTYRSPLTGSPQTVAHALLLRRGWSEGQWTCLDPLWTRESGWQVTATNPSSGAYGIPQALPAAKMAAAGADWRTNPLTQIEWGLSYIASSYGSPCAALQHSSSYGYY